MQGKWIAISACILGVVYLAANDLDAWGWLIFLAILLLGA